MKKTFLLLVFTICAITVIYAQSPFKYQAVIRDNNGNVLPNKNVGLRISVLQGVTPASVYKEEHNKTSDQFGVINVEVGTGTVLSGNYLTINWGAVNNQLQVDIDMNGGTTYTLLGTSSILSVPVANYAVKAGSATFPAGMIIAFAGDTSKIPTGWLLCDGREVNRNTYNDLLQAIGVSWGSGDMINTFNLPDLRGQFLRGTDLGSGKDPDVSTRTLNNSAIMAGSKVGTYEKDTISSHYHAGSTANSGSLSMSGSTSSDGNHTHTLNARDQSDGYVTVHGSGWGADGHTFTTSSAGNHSHTVTTSGGSHMHSLTTYNTGGNETRPKNAYVNYIIKY